MVSYSCCSTATTSAKGLPPPGWTRRRACEILSREKRRPQRERLDEPPHQQRNVGAERGEEQPEALVHRETATASDGGTPA
ncbi:hypothetical protein DIPPA_30202 [Diplonema papillatum]|nr:hypothetical protein DIPPA_30202 [Diplonema papillatum]